MLGEAAKLGKSWGYHDERLGRVFIFHDVVWHHNNDVMSEPHVILAVMSELPRRITDA